MPVELASVESMYVDGEVGDEERQRSQTEQTKRKEQVELDIKKKLIPKY